MNNTRETLRRALDYVAIIALCIFIAALFEAWPTDVENDRPAPLSQ